MQWWCSAQAAEWSWSWQPYPGVWLFVIGLAVAYALLRRRAGPGTRRGRGAGGAPTTEAGDPGGRDPGATSTAGGAFVDRHGRWFLAGLVLVWAALDWPVGPLGASYLASVHMLQVLVLSLVAPAFLLLGVPPEAWRAARTALGRRAGPRRAVAALTHPVTALVLFNGVVVGTHVPAVLDTLARSQAGMLLMDVAWLAAGVVFWWPVLARVPERPWFGRFFQMGYLFLNTIPATVPYGFLVFAEFPLYSVYELAPPLPGLATVPDQQIAGFVMKLGGGLILWTAITILFFRWYREEGDRDLRSRPSPS